MAGPMLRELRIRNFAVIEAVDGAVRRRASTCSPARPAPASRSLIDALLLVTRRARPARRHPHRGRHRHRRGASSSVDPAARRPRGAGGGRASRRDDGELVVRRELARSGRHRAFVNDSPVTVGAARAAGRRARRGARPARAPAAAGAGPPARAARPLRRRRGAPRARVGALCAEWRSGARRALARLRDEARERDRASARTSALPGLRARRRALCATGEEDELRAERRRLQHAERITAGLARGRRRSSTRTPQSAAARLAPRGARSCATSARHRPGVRRARRRRSRRARGQVEEALGRAPRAARPRAVSIPSGSSAIDDRLDALARLKRKYGDTEAAMLRFRARGGADARSARAPRRDAGRAGARGRRGGGGAGRGGRGALGAPGRRGARPARAPGPDGDPRRSAWSGRFGWRCAASRPARTSSRRPRRLAGGPRGAETAEFLLSANPGEELAAARQGRLGRRALAHDARADARCWPRPTTSPRWSSTRWTPASAAAWPTVVGQKLAPPAAGRQVLCVTHLAPIAAYAPHHHLRVEKSVRRGAHAHHGDAARTPARASRRSRGCWAASASPTRRVAHARELLRARPA